jgi:hypothetical protein
MKPNRFLRLFFLLLAANAGVYFPSCQRDAEQSQVKPLSDTPGTERGICTSADYCIYIVTATTTGAVVFCGDIEPYTGSCVIGCGTLGADRALSVTLTANVPYEICVLKNGSVCIQNSPTATQSISITVTAGTGSSLNETLDPSEIHCFHSNNACDETNDGCF